MNAYTFGAPLHMVFAACVIKNKPSLNGKPLSIEEQKALSVLLWSVARITSQRLAFSSLSVAGSIESKSPSNLCGIIPSSKQL